jgi:hypothetical protein
MTGFDGNNNPQYGTVQTISMTLDQGTQPIQNYSYPNALSMDMWEPSTAGVYAIADYVPRLVTGTSYGTNLYSNVAPAKFSYYATNFSDTNYIYLPPTAIAMQALGTSWTIEAWLKTSSSGTQTAISFGTPTAYVTLGSAGGNFVATLLGPGPTSAGAAVNSGIAINNGAWHHCVLVSYGSSLATFVDGAAGATLASGFVPIINGPGNVGKSVAAAGQAWSGQVDELALWGYSKYGAPFTPPSVAYIGNEANLTALYHLDNAPTNADTTVTTSQFIPHIGGIKPGRSTYLWTALPEKYGTFLLPGGYYPAGKGAGNYGSGIFTEGRHILMTGCSQSMTQGPINWHFWEDGMIIGEFGPYVGNQWQGLPAKVFFNPLLAAVYSSMTLQPPSIYQGSGWRGMQPKMPALAENCGVSRTTSVNGNIYFFVSVEATQRPTSVWMLSNLSSIHEMASAPAALGGSVIVNQPVF